MVRAVCLPGAVCAERCRCDRSPQRGRRSAFGRAAPALRRLPENRRCGRKGAGRGNTGCRVLSLVDCVQQRKPQIFQQCVGELIVFLLHPFCLRHIGGRVVPRPHSAENIGDICRPEQTKMLGRQLRKALLEFRDQSFVMAVQNMQGGRKCAGKEIVASELARKTLYIGQRLFGIRRCCLQRRGCPRAGRPRPAR